MILFHPVHCTDRRPSLPTSTIIRSAAAALRFVPYLVLDLDLIFLRMIRLPQYCSVRTSPMSPSARCKQARTTTFFWPSLGDLGDFLWTSPASSVF